MARSLTEDQRIVHFLNRTSFGPTENSVARVKAVGISTYLEEQLRPDALPDPIVDERILGLKTIRLSNQELLDRYPTPQMAKRRGMTVMDGMRGPRVIILELQQARLLRAIYSQKQLFEVMVDFWSNHFNIFAGKGADRWMVTSYDRETIRPHALGRFKDLLLATAQSPAMLFYLDNWLSATPNPRVRLGPNNRKRGLNENYAREIMELHTIGVDGGYTQKDVHEVARCFTGWTIRRPRGEAKFVFDRRIHDDGEKIVLGRQIPTGGGMDDGLRVIDMLASHPATARFIATKLARRFVADDPPAAIVNRATDAFRRSDGDIPTVIRAIVEAPEFYSPEVVQSKIKKPLEFVASTLRLTEADTRVTPQLSRYVARMGEPLFLAQAPTGFSDVASSWVSPDMLLTRINFVADLIANRLNGTRVNRQIVAETERLANLIAPGALSATTREALAQAKDTEATAMLLAAPEFQRR